jgi:hypothetical protein
MVDGGRQKVGNMQARKCKFRISNIAKIEKAHVLQAIISKYVP